MKYRKKPVVIEAVQWTGKSHREMFDFLENRPDKSITTTGEHFYIDHDKIQGGLIFKTLKGEHLASIGDFIIKGVHGEFYPCKPDIFCKTYEPVDEKKENDNAGEVVSKLLYLAENSRSKHDVLLAAVNLVKSQQAENAELKQQLAVKENALKKSMDLNDEAGELMEALALKLVASRRREQAAVEDIEFLMRNSGERGACKLCVHRCIINSRVKPKCCDAKWHGPQEAGKGDTK